jgi:7,8-dihydropterin-6-yl-methyl-4-(beta-D-ribofuranosyl)aminobenzene 5'-phosphate synthase
MFMGLNLRVVVEDSACQTDTSMWSQHGLCIFMELDLGSDKMRILIDTGSSSEVTLHNIDALNLNLDDIDLIFLSHGHYDHTGGLMGILKRMNRRVPVLAHPEIFAPKLKGLPFLRFIGPPFTRMQAESAGAVMLGCRGAVTIAPGVMSTGEVPRIDPFEKVEGFWTFQDGQFCQDTIPDDQSMAAVLPGKGLVVITGCAHCGIINTIRHAQKITGVEKLHAVIGGFHLMNADDKRIESTAEALKGLDSVMVRPGHCTGQKAVCRLQQALGERCRPLAVGDLIQI